MAWQVAILTNFRRKNILKINVVISTFGIQNALHTYFELKVKMFSPKFSAKII
jgi:hypothetical protein